VRSQDRRHPHIRTTDADAEELAIVRNLARSLRDGERPTDGTNENALASPGFNTV
jgi:hypothetical protein